VSPEQGYVTKELFDERTKNMCRDLKSIKYSVSSIPLLTARVEEHENFIEKQKMLMAKVITTVILAVIAGGLMSYAAMSF
jgi:hypothetical protein